MKFFFDNVCFVFFCFAGYLLLLILFSVTSVLLLLFTGVKLVVKH